jgi:hypothetical protein
MESPDAIWGLPAFIAPSGIGEPGEEIFRRFPKTEINRETFAALSFAIPASLKAPVSRSAIRHAMHPGLRFWESDTVSER